MRKTTLLSISNAIWTPVLLALGFMATSFGMAKFGPSELARGLILVGCAVAVLFAWRLVAMSGRTRNSSTFHDCLLYRCRGVLFGVAWTLVWFVLPAWTLMKLIGLLLFVPVMAWRWWSPGNRSLQSRDLLLGWALGLAVTGWLLMASDFQRERLLQVLGFGQDFSASHYAWHRLLEVLSGLKTIGISSVGVHPMLMQGDDSSWLLRVGVSFGGIPMIAMGCFVVLGWMLLLVYLCSTPVGALLSLRGGSTTLNSFIPKDS